MTNCLDIALGQDYRTVKVVKNITPIPKAPIRTQAIEPKQQNSKNDKNSKMLKHAIAALAGMGTAAVIMCNPIEIKKLKKKGNEILEESKPLLEDALKTKEHAKKIQEGADKIIEELSMEILENNGNGLRNKKNGIYSKAGEYSSLIAEYKKSGSGIDIENITIIIRNKFRTIINCDSGKVRDIKFGVHDYGNRVAGRYKYGPTSSYARNIVRNGKEFIPQNIFNFDGDECSRIINTISENVRKGLTPREFIYKDGKLDAFIDSSLKDAQGKIVEKGKIYLFNNGVFSIMKNLTKENKIVQNYIKILHSIFKN